MTVVSLFCRLRREKILIGKERIGMEKKEMKIKIFNVMRYERKEDKSPRTKISLYFSSENNIRTSEKFKGFAIVDFYFNGYDVFNKITSNLIDVELTGVFKSEPTPSNPFKERLLLESLVTKNGTINLLQ